MTIIKKIKTISITFWPNKYQNRLIRILDLGFEGLYTEGIIEIKYTKNFTRKELEEKISILIKEINENTDLEIIEYKIL